MAVEVLNKQTNKSIILFFTNENYLCDIFRRHNGLIVEYAAKVVPVWKGVRLPR